MKKVTDAELLGHFEESPNGAFYRRYGPAYEPDRAYCNKKLCFAATDVELLAEVLYELSLRSTCYFVKFSRIPRDGMYLGRCFLLGAEEVGQTWAFFKNHPRLFCQVQDDDFTGDFRPSRRWPNTFDHYQDDLDPAASEVKLRAHLARHHQRLSVDERHQLETQIARALIMQQCFDTARDILNEVEGKLAPEVGPAHIRHLIERGRLKIQSRQGDRGMADLLQAYDRAGHLSIDDLAADAARLLATVDVAQARFWQKRAESLESLAEG